MLFAKASFLQYFPLFFNREEEVAGKCMLYQCSYDATQKNGMRK